MSCILSKGYISKSTMKRTTTFLIALALSPAILTGCKPEEGAADTTQTSASQPMAHNEASASSSQQLHDLMMRPMQNMKMSGNVDKDFSSMMAEHHEQAVEMAKIEIASGSNDVLKNMAQNMLDAQTSEREMLLQHAAELKDAAQPSAASNEMHMVMMQPMGSMNVSGNVDKDFAILMAAHHEMAIKMADIEMKSGSNDHIKSMAKKMKEDQTKEREKLLRMAAQIQ